MAYALDCSAFPNVNGRINVTSGWKPTDFDNWSVEIRFKTSSNVTNDQFVIGYEQGSTRSWKMFVSANKIGILHRTAWVGAGIINSATTALPDTEYTARAEQLNGVFSLYINNVLENSAAREPTFNGLDIVRTMTATSSGTVRQFNGFIYEAWANDPVAPSNSTHWDASAANGTGGILFDILTNRNATISDAPIDDTHWVYYDNGPVTENYSFLATLPLSLLSTAEAIKLALISGALDTSVNLNGTTNKLSTFVSALSTVVGLTPVMGKSSSYSGALACSVSIAGSTQKSGAFAGSIGSTVGLDGYTNKTGLLTGTINTSINLSGALSASEFHAFIGSLSISASLAALYVKSGQVTGSVAATIGAAAVQNKSSLLSGVVGAQLDLAAPFMSKLTTLSGSLGVDIDVLSGAEKTAILLSNLLVGVSLSIPDYLKSSDFASSFGLGVSLGGTLFDASAPTLEDFYIRVDGAAVVANVLNSAPPIVQNIRSTIYNGIRINGVAKL